MQQNETNFLNSLRQLEIGGRLEMPLSRRSYVRSACSAFALEWDKEFTTQTDKIRRIVVITRIG